MIAFQTENVFALKNTPYCVLVYNSKYKKVIVIKYVN